MCSLWVEKSITLDQFLPSDFEKMVCIETANAERDFVRLLPNQTHRLGIKVTGTF
jgi:glucose-6-phosphate 1-epimerase